LSAGNRTHSTSDEDGTRDYAVPNEKRRTCFPSPQRTECKKNGKVIFKQSLKQARDSNLELLRLVCMLFIIILHFITKALNITGHRLILDGTGLPNTTGIISCSFIIIAVNCFVLISGYYGIKAKWKRLFLLYIMCVFYFLIFGLFDIYINNVSIKDFIFNTFFPFSHSYDLWFIPCYVLLYLLAPLLNKAVASINKREFVVLLILCSILTFYLLGYIWNKNTLASNLMLFVFLYLIGKFISIHVTVKRADSGKYLFAYVLCSLIIAGIGLLVFNLPINNKWIYLLCFPYMSPLVVFSAIAFFLWFRCFHFQSKIINWAASSALAIYLIHENGFSKKIYMRYIYELGERIDNGFLLALGIVFIAFGLVIACILVDKIRMLITDPIAQLFDRMDIDRHIGKLVDKITSCLG
jgi:surface polysaccharide O-acyltransferase-like enzyme